MYKGTDMITISHVLCVWILYMLRQVTKTACQVVTSMLGLLCVCIIY